MAAGVWLLVRYPPPLWPHRRHYHPTLEPEPERPKRVVTAAELKALTTLDDYIRLAFDLPVRE